MKSILADKDALLFYLSAGAAVLMAVGRYEFFNAEGFVVFVVLLIVMVTARRDMRRSAKKREAAIFRPCL